MVSAPEQPACTGPDGVCLAPPAQSPGTVHADTGSILAERQFHHSTSWVDHVDGWWHRVLADLVRWFFSGSGLTIAGLVLAGVLVVVGLVLAARLAWRVQSDPAVRIHEDEVGRRPVDWQAEADAHAAAGEWRPALRCRYRALIAELAEREVVEEIPGRTAREYEQQVRRRAPAAAAAFDQASEMFESVWYGFEPCGPDDLERFATLAGEVTTMTRRRRQLVPA